MKRLLLIMLLAPFLIVSAYAEDGSTPPDAGFDVRAVRDALPEDVRDVGGELRLDGDYDSAGALERLWNRFLGQIADSLRESAREVFAVLALAMLCTLGSVLTQGQKQAEYIQIAGCAAASCLLADGTGSLVGRATAALSELSDYASAVLPAVYSAAAACGAPGSASARYAASCFALDTLMAASQRLILPLIYATIAMAVCGSIFDNPLLKSGLKLTKKLAGMLMTGMTMVFTGFLSVTGLVTGSADAASVKATKTVISAAIPVVGKILSDAASSVLAAASLVRNAAGAFGLVAVCALCVAPFAAFGVRKLMFSLAAAAAEMTAGERMARLLGEFSSVMGILLGLVGCYGVMLLMSIVSAIRTVTG